MGIFREPLGAEQLGPLRDALLRGKLSAVVLMRLLHEVLLLSTAPSAGKESASESTTEAGEHHTDIESQLMKARMPYAIASDA